MHAHRTPVVVAAVGALLVLAARDAHAFDESSSAVVANKGLHFGIGPVLLVPPENRPIGGGLVLDARYGIGISPAIVSPGARLAGYFISGHFIGMAMPTARLTFPLGPFAPFLVGGVGAGWLTNAADGNHAGVALLGGGGLMIHLGRVLAIGVEATYQTITSTEFKSFALGPSFVLSF